MRYIETTTSVVQVVNYIALALTIIFAVITLVMRKKEKDETFSYDLSKFIYKNSLLTLIISGAIRGMLYGADTGNPTVILMGVLVIAAYVIKEEYF